MRIRTGFSPPEEADRFLDATFAGTDVDDDRRLTSKEWSEFGFGLAYVARSNNRVAQYNAAKETSFAGLDTNGDDFVSRDEFLTGLKSEFAAANSAAGGAERQLTYDEFLTTTSVKRLADAVLTPKSN